MNQLTIAENIVRLRRQRKMTQEQLADFVGVTKASVSKWETKQSTPDIVLLPQLASFFDITVDELLGYNPHLSREQIARYYQDLAADFAHLPFETVMEKSNQLIKLYYNCYPFLLQTCILWLNHYMLADSASRQQEVLMSLINLSKRIITECKDLGICSDAMILISCANLFMGQSKEVIEALEDVVRPDRLVSQSDTLLIDAYMLSNDLKHADGFAQISMYNHLLALVSTATKFLTIHQGDLSVCKETIHRIEGLITSYQLEHLHPNASGLFYYQTAIIYTIHKQNQDAIRYLNKCISSMQQLLEGNSPTLHGDDYFNSIEEQFTRLGIEKNAPRNKLLILNDVKNLLNNPVFADLEAEPEFRLLNKKLKEIS